MALVFILYTYFGWNVAGYIAGEIADPHRVIPRIMIGGTACVAVIYLLVNLVYLCALPAGVLAQRRSCRWLKRRRPHCGARRARDLSP